MKDMTSLQRCFLIFVSMLLYKSPIPVQGRIIDAKPPTGKFDETKADAGVPDCFSHVVGVANATIIPDKQMTASTYYSSNFQPAYGRLNINTVNVWCTKTPSRNGEWLQVDLGKFFKVCGVATQGDSVFNEGVEAFELKYSLDGKNWATYRDEYGLYMQFYRNGKSSTVEQHKLKPFYARYIRFYPIQQKGWNCLRVEVYGTNVELHDVSPSDCGKKLFKRIVGGQHASPGEWPWHVEFRGILHYGSTVCSASLLTPQWVITAEHCVRKLDAADIKLTLGQHTRSKVSGKEQIHSVSKLVFPPETGRLWNDIVLMKLTNPATINDHVASICLPESTERLPAGTVCWETGWGISDDGSLSDVLKELEVVIAPRGNATNWSRLPDRAFITATKQEEHGTCRGDSGGPVVNERNGRWYLEGVHSWGRPSGCGKAGEYDGQADVRAVLPWIADTIKNN